MWLIYAISASIIWGLDYALGEKIFKSKISPVSLLVFQLFFGLILFLIIGARAQLKTDLAILTSDFKTLWLVIVALLTFNFGNLLIFLSIQSKNATVAGLIELCYPIFTVFFSWILFRENHLSASVAVGGALIFLGVFIIGYYS